MKRYIIALVLIMILHAGYAQLVLIPYRVNDKWGYSSVLGKIKIKPQFDYASPFEDDVATVMIKRGKGLINRSGKILVPCLYEQIETIGYWKKKVPGPILYNRAIVTTRNGKLGMYDLSSGKLLLDTIYKSIKDGHGSMCDVVTSDGKAGVYDFRLTKWIADPVYSAVSFIGTDDTILAIQGRDRFLIPVLRNGPGAKIAQPWPPPARIIKDEVIEEVRLLAPAEKPAEKPPASEPGEKKPTAAELYYAQLFQVKGLYGFAFAYQYAGDSIPPLYDKIDRSTQYSGKLAVKKNGKWGVVNSKNRVLLPLQYQGIDIGESKFESSLFVVSDGSKRSIVDSSGQVLASGYDLILPGKGSFFILMKNGLYGVFIYGYNKKPLLIEPQFYGVEKEMEKLSLSENKDLLLLRVWSGSKLYQSSYLSVTGKKYFSDLP